MFRVLRRLSRNWKPLDFSNPNFIRIDPLHRIEEETIPIT